MIYITRFQRHGETQYKAIQGSFDSFQQKDIRYEQAGDGVHLLNSPSEIITAGCETAVTRELLFTPVIEVPSSNIVIENCFLP